ncbi:MAG: ComEC family competence protein [Ruminococcus sp.]|nr:ComEC family competence protein [Ruminococcus sp.]
MIGAAASYMSGLFFASFFTDLRIYLLVIPFLFGLLVYSVREKWKKSDYILTAAVFLTGFAVFSGYTEIKYNSAAMLNGTTGTFTGEVVSVKRYDRGLVSYVLKGTANGETNVKLTFFGDDTGAVYGDEIKLEECEFSLIESDYLFDSERYYKSDGVFLSAESTGNLHTEKKHRRIIKNLTAEFRENMIFKFSAETDSDTGAFLGGMLFGEKHGLDDSIKTALYRSGIGHILAVSGLHVSILAAVLMFFLKRLHIGKAVSLFLMNLLLFGFILLADTPVSAVRAAVMMNFMYSAPLFRRQNDSLNSLSGASLLICLCSPYSIYDEGFLLSLSGTFGIAVFAPFMTKNMKTKTLTDKLTKDFVTGICTCISVFPMSMIFFGESSVVSPISNILLVPLCTVSMIFGIVYMLSNGMIPVLVLSEILIKTVISVSENVAEIRFSHIAHISDKTSEMVLFLGFACVGIYLLVRNRKAVFSAVTVSFLVFLTVSAYTVNRRNNEFRIAVLGKNTNASAVVSYRGQTDIIDLSGHHRTPEYVSVYLSENGIEKAEYLILAKNPQSQYTAYAENMKNVNAEYCLALSDTEINGAEISDYFDESGFHISRNEYEIDFADGVLEIVYSGNRVYFVPSADSEKSDGTNIVYGRKTDDRNYEIVLSEKGLYRRRL